MTISTDKVKINAVGTGSQTNFPYDFKVVDATHMLVYLDNVLYGGAYTVNGVGNPAGGSVDIPTPPGLDVVVTLYREVPNTQKTDYEPYNSFPSETTENDLDLAAMRDQQLNEVDGRAVKAPVNDDGSFDYTLPAVAAGKGIKANATGDGWVETTHDPDAAQADSAANVVLTDADAVSTAADAVDTAADVVSTAADVVATNADVVDAQGWNDLAAEWAENPEDTAVTGHPGEYSALHWAAKAQALVGNVKYSDQVLLSYIVGGGVGGGATVAATWTTKSINTEDYDSGNICTLLANQITLPAGTYLIRGKAIMASNSGLLRLQNITNALTEVLGMTITSVTVSEYVVLPILGRFTLTGTKTLEIQYYMIAGAGSFGEGFPVDAGNNTYAQFEILKEI